MEIFLKKINENEKLEKINEKNLFTVVTCVIEYRGQILALQRARKDAQFGLWGIPGGKLSKDETPREGLSREIFEETQIRTKPSDYIYLTKAFSKNPFDKSYLLYLYYLNLDKQPSIIIQNDEHLDHQWIEIEKFLEENLLLSQGKAFELVKDQVLELSNKNNLLTPEKSI